MPIPNSSNFLDDLNLPLTELTQKYQQAWASVGQSLNEDREKNRFLFTMEKHAALMKSLQKQRSRDYSKNVVDTKLPLSPQSKAAIATLLSLEKECNAQDKLIQSGKNYLTTLDTVRVSLSNESIDNNILETANTLIEIMQNTDFTQFHELAIRQVANQLNDSSFRTPPLSIDKLSGLPGESQDRFHPDIAMRYFFISGLIAAAVIPFLTILPEAILYIAVYQFFITSAIGLLRIALALLGLDSCLKTPRTGMAKAMTDFTESVDAHNRVTAYTAELNKFSTHNHPLLNNDIKLVKEKILALRDKEGALNSLTPLLEQLNALIAQGTTDSITAFKMENNPRSCAKRCVRFFMPAQRYELDQAVHQFLDSLLNTDETRQHTEEKARELAQHIGTPART